MTNERANAFAVFADPPEFQPKPKADKKIANEAIDRVAKENNFPSRQVPKPVREQKRKPNHYRTGRNRQLNIKATEQTGDRLYRMASERKVPLGALLELALDALEQGSTDPKPSQA